MRIRCLIALLLSANGIVAQVTADSNLFHLTSGGVSKTEQINFNQMESDSVMLDSCLSIEGFAITGYVTQLKNNSFIRIILQDTDGGEYVVLETSRLYNDVDTLRLVDYCEETNILPDISPYMLRIYANEATVELSHVTIQILIKDRKAKQDDRITHYNKILRESRQKQSQFIANCINKNNKLHHRIWRAEATDLSTMSWKDRKRILGIDERCQPTGFEYYSSGIFEIGEVSNESNMSQRTISPYVDSFDWRNRHGINWMTSVKHQSTGNSCWAFAPVGVTEALVNLYFNSKIDYNLSEQEVISCSGCGSNALGGYEGCALEWISSNGVSEESSFPFSNSDEPCSNKGSYEELITMNGTSSVQNHNINNNDSVKNALIKYGPLTSGFMYNNGSYHGHVMVLTGYSTLHEGDTIRYFGSYNQSPNNFDVIQNGDSRIGKTYWIFKNSYGPNRYYEHRGYAYVLFNDQSCFRKPYYAKTPISSLNYCDTNINVTDNDGDGYYFWGIGQKPAHCPSWVPDIPDGDDHDYAMGPINEYGHLYDLESHVNDTVFVTSNIIWSQKRYIYNNIFVPNGVTLTIQDDVVFYNGARITIQGGTLHIDGGHLYNADIITDINQNSDIIISNGGQIEKSANSQFVIPRGTVFRMTSGAIK